MNGLQVKAQDIIRMVSFIMGVGVGLYRQNPYPGIDWAHALWGRDDLGCKY